MHPMKRKVLIVLLSLGTVFGFAGGALSVAKHSHHRRAAFERHVAQLCADAARHESAADKAGAPPSK